MKDHAERKERLQLIEYMFAGYSWQSAVAQSQLNVSRATAYRLRQLARDEQKAALAFLVLVSPAKWRLSGGLRAY